MDRPDAFWIKPRLMADDLAAHLEGTEAALLPSEAHAALKEDLEYMRHLIQEHTVSGIRSEPMAV
jgi:hypothetical protein